MSEGVNITFSATIEDFAAKLARMEAMNEKLIGQNRKLRSESEDAGSAGMDFLKGQAVAAAGLVTSLLTVEGALRAIGAAYDYNRRQAEKAKDSAVSTGDAQGEIIRNLGKVSVQEQRKFLDEADKIAAKFPVKGGRPQTYDMLGQALSSSGSDQKASLQAVEIASQLSPEDPEGAKVISGGILALAKATKSKDAKRNAGLLIQTGAESPSPKLQAVAQNTIPGIIGVTGFGDSPAEASALNTTLAQASGDIEGARAANASINLAKQLAEKFPEKDTPVYHVGPDGRARLVGTRRGTGLTSTRARIEYLQKNPDVFAQQIGPTGEGISLEAKQLKPALEMMQSKGSTTGKIFSDILGRMESNSDTAGFTDDLTTRLGDPIERKMAKFARTQEAMKASLAGTLMMKQKAVAGLLSKEQMRGMLEMSGASWSEAAGEDFKFTASQVLGGEAVQRYQAAGESQLHRLRYDKRVLGGFGQMAFTEDVSTKDPERLQAAAVFETMFKEQLSQLKVMTEELVQLRAELGKKPSPAAIQNNTQAQKEPAKQAF